MLKGINRLGFFPAVEPVDPLGPDVSQLLSLSNRSFHILLWHAASSPEDQTGEVPTLKELKIQAAALEAFLKFLPLGRGFSRETLTLMTRFFHMKQDDHRIDELTEMGVLVKTEEAYSIPAPLSEFLNLETEYPEPPLSIHGSQQITAKPWLSFKNGISLLDCSVLELWNP